MCSGLSWVVSIIEALRAMTLRKGRTPTLAAVVAIGAVCMTGCGGIAPRLTSSLSEIVPGTVPVDTFWVDDMYKAVKIGDVTWMAKNLDIKNGKSWCPNDDSYSCAIYGRLYDWNTAMNICPPGWHLPSTQEWVDLEAMAGGNKVAAKRLKSTTYGGTDDYGFSALPNGRWWTSTKYDDGTCNDCGEHAYIANLNHYDIIGHSSWINNGLPVRCILDD